VAVNRKSGVIVKNRGAVVGSVFPIKGSLSNDLKSRDSVYITTARERERERERERAMRSRAGRFFGFVLFGVTIIRNKEIHSYLF